MKHLLAGLWLCLPDGSARPCSRCGAIRDTTSAFRVPRPRRNRCETRSLSAPTSKDHAANQPRGREHQWHDGSARAKVTTCARSRCTGSKSALRADLGVGHMPILAVRNDALLSWRCGTRPWSHSCRYGRCGSEQHAGLPSWRRPPKREAGHDHPAVEVGRRPRSVESAEQADLLPHGRWAEENSSPLRAASIAPMPARLEQPPGRSRP